MIHSLCNLNQFYKLQNIQDPIPSLPYGIKNLNQICKSNIVTSSTIHFYFNQSIYQPNHGDVSFVTITNFKEFKIFILISYEPKLTLNLFINL